MPSGNKPLPEPVLAKISNQCWSRYSTPYEVTRPQWVIFFMKMYFRDITWFSATSSNITLCSCNPLSFAHRRQTMIDAVPISTDYTVAGCFIRQVPVKANMQLELSLTPLVALLLVFEQHQSIQEVYLLREHGTYSAFPWDIPSTSCKEVNITI